MESEAAKGPGSRAGARAATDGASGPIGFADSRIIVIEWRDTIAVGSWGIPPETSVLRVVRR